MTNKNKTGMKNVVIICLLMAMGMSACRPSQEELPVLTKQQMREDFDYLYEVIKEVNPQLTIRKKVTGVDILENIQSLYPELKKTKKFEDFWVLVEKALNLCQDMHYSLYIPYETQNNIDEEIIALNKKYHQIIFGKVRQPFTFSVLKYYNGNYYTYIPLETSRIIGNKKIIIEPGSQLIEMEGMPIDDYVAKVNPSLGNTTTAYDRELKKLFSIRPILQGSIKSCKFKDAKGDIIKHGSNLVIRSNYSEIMGTPQVIYFPDTKIVFIRIPEMNTELIDYFKEEIPKIANDKEIAKVVVDVRSNGGGNDAVWHTVLSLITKDTLTANQRLLVRNTPMVHHYLKEIRTMKMDTIPIVEIPFLDNESFIDFSFTSFDYEPVFKIEPSENSLNYTGKIFLLVDERSFSSTLNFLEFATLNPDKFVTIGEYGGYKGGQAGTPFTFVLPNSKITFRIDAMIDYNNVEKAEDFFHGDIMVPVKVTVKEYHDCMLTEKGRFEKEFLYTKDPMFKKVLEIE